MNEKSHIIKQQSFLAEYDNESNSLQFQHRFSNLIKNSLLPQIEAVFNNFDKNEGIIRIDSLSVDLGEVDADEMDNELPQRLADRLFSALKDKVNDIQQGRGNFGEEVITEEALLLDSFLYYLQSGTMLWWGKEYIARGYGYEQIFEGLIRIALPQLMQRLPETLRSTIARNRFLKFIGDEWILMYLGKAYPEALVTFIGNSHSLVLPILEKLEAAFRKKWDHRQTFWQYVFDWLWLQGAPEIDSDTFQQSLVRHLLLKNEVSATEINDRLPEIMGNLSEKERSVFADAVAVEESFQKIMAPLLLKGSLAQEGAKTMTGAFHASDLQWVAHLEEEQFIAVLKRSLPKEHAYVIAFIGDVIRILRSKGVRLTHSEQFVRVVWESVIHYLFVVKRGDFEKADFLQSSLGHVAVFLRLNLQGVVHYLHPELSSLRDLPSSIAEKALSDTSPLDTEELQLLKQVAYKYFLVFGSLPTHSVLKSALPQYREAVLDMEVLNLSSPKALVQGLVSMNAKEVTALFADIDILVLPLVLKRLKLQLPQGLIKELMDKVPSLQWIEFVDNSFSGVEESLLKKINALQGTLSAILDAWTQDYASDEDREAEALRLLATLNISPYQERSEEITEEGEEVMEKGEGTTERGKRIIELALIDFMERPERLPKGWTKVVLIKALKAFVQLPASESAKLKVVITTNALVEKIRNTWVDQLPENVLLDLARWIKPQQISNIVQKVELYIARKVKADGYRSTLSEWKQLKWKLIFEKSTTAMEKLLKEQHAEYDKEERERKKNEKANRQEQMEATFGNEPLYVNNAGLVIFHPYLQRFFKMLGLLEDNRFKDDAAASKAVYLLHYLAYKDQEMPEYEMTLNKLLCGMEVFATLDEPAPLTDKEKEVADSLIKGVIANWKAISNSSIDNFRVSFLHREGKLEKSLKGSWQMEVGQKGYDVLMGSLPWSLNIIKLPWMKTTLYVNWGDDKSSV